jgi:hypothetical protein
MAVKSILRKLVAASFAAWMAIVPAGLAHACTYIRLKAENGSYVVGRTMEWGTFDLESSLSIAPRGTPLTAMKMPDGKSGASWNVKYGFTGITILFAGQRVPLSTGSRPTKVSGATRPHCAYGAAITARLAASRQPTKRSGAIGRRPTTRSSARRISAVLSALSAASTKSCSSTSCWA